MATESEQIMKKKIKNKEKFIITRAGWMKIAKLYRKWALAERKISDALERRLAKLETENKDLRKALK